jgi:phage gpG-like protein
VLAQIDVRLNLSRLQQLAGELHGNVDQAVEQIAKQAVTEVQAVIVDKDIIDTGALLNSITYWKIGDAQYAVSDGVDYGIYNQFGHRTPGGGWFPARPFMDVGVLTACQGFADVVGEWVFQK